MKLTFQSVGRDVTETTSERNPETLVAALGSGLPSMDLASRLLSAIIGPAGASYWGSQPPITLPEPSEWLGMLGADGKFAEVLADGAKKSAAAAMIGIGPPVGQVDEAGVADSRRLEHEPEPAVTAIKLPPIVDKSLVGDVEQWVESPSLKLALGSIRSAADTLVNASGDGANDVLAAERREVAYEILSNWDKVLQPARVRPDVLATKSSGDVPSQQQLLEDLRAALEPIKALLKPM